MIGAIIGDVIGSRFEFNNTRNYSFDLFTDECSFTDDTICTVAIMDAIMSGCDYKGKLLEWCKQFTCPMGGYGGSFARWIRSDDPQPYNSFGNGSAMRVSPVAWAFDKLEDVKREAERTASVTHNHPEGIKGAVAVAHAIWYFRNPINAHKPIRCFIEAMNEYYPGFDDQEYQIGVFDETCQGTVPLCLSIVTHAHDFEDAIRMAISHGGDSDTIGAIVGSIAEARFGVPTRIYSLAMSFLHWDMVDVIRRFDLFVKDK